MRRLAPALAAAALLALPGLASAQVPLPTPTPPPVVPTPTPTPPPAPVQAKGTLSLTTKGVFGAGRNAATLKGRSFSIRGVLRPYIAGEKVVVRVYRDGKKIRAKSLTPKPVPGNQAGVITLKIGAPKSGRIAIKASHAATPLLATTRARTLRLQVILPEAGPGSAGPAVHVPADPAGRAALRRAAQRRL